LNAEDSQELRRTRSTSHIRVQDLINSIGHRGHGSDEPLASWSTAKWSKSLVLDRTGAACVPTTGNDGDGVGIHLFGGQRWGVYQQTIASHIAFNGDKWESRSALPLPIDTHAACFARGLGKSGSIITAGI
jgi:hypothetical protein